MIRVIQYSDVLCVWACVSQVRIDELRRNFGDQVEVEYRFMPVFGDVGGKIETMWSDRGGLPGYAAHVQDVAAGFEHIRINPRVWLDNTPASSLPAHLVLCGTRLIAGDDGVQTLLQRLRSAFFEDLVDISSGPALTEITADAGIDTDALHNVMESGRAHARLAADMAAAQTSGIKASPTLLLNEGRQMLAGNVGYRVIEANIRELLETPGDRQSWC